MYFTLVLVGVVFGFLFYPGAIYSDVPIDDFSNIDDLNDIRDFGKTRIPFIENRGQVDKQVNYYVHTFAGPVFVTNSEIRYALSLNHDSMTSYIFDEKFLNSNDLRPIGISKSDSVVNYITGNQDWNQNVSTFDSVFMQNVWDSIDVRLNAHGNNIEKIFLVHPHVDPASIRMGFDGIDRLAVNENGELIISIGDDLISMTSPIAYQYIDGQKKSVDVSYTIHGNEYSFDVKNYDQNYILIIDPLLASTFLGTASGLEGIVNVVMDSAGSIFVTGTTQSINFPTTTGAFDETFNFNQDIYVSKFSNDLSTLESSTFIGANDSPSMARNIGIDLNGNIYVVGDTNSQNFPTTPGAFVEMRSRSDSEGFVVKLGNDLSTILASTYLGGTGIDSISTITFDDFGNVYVAAATKSIDYPTTIGAYDQTANGNVGDIAISKLSSDLSTLLASTYIGGTNFDSPTGLVHDGTGSIFVSGNTGSANFPTTIGAFDETYNGNDDGFVSKLDRDLTTLQASTFIGGSNVDGVLVSMDDFGNVFVVGDTNSPDFPLTAGSFDNTPNGYFDGYISKFSSDLTILQASTLIGGYLNDFVRTIAFDQSGKVFVGGRVDSPNFPVTVGAFDDTYNGNADGFVASFDNDLTTLFSSTFIGGGGLPQGTGPRSVAVGNFNGDLTQDLAVANFGAPLVSVLLGKDEGKFDTINNYATASATSSVAVGNFNGDTIDDLAATSTSFGRVSVFIGNGDGTFGAATSLSTGTGPFSVAVGDFNSDARQDLAVANAGGVSDPLYTISILLGNGDGTFGAATNFVVGSAPQSIAIGDFDGDTIQDLVTANSLSNDISILLGNGDGTFGAATSQTLGSRPTSVAIGDFNSDTIQDLAVTVEINNVTILLGNGDGTFGAATNFVVGSAPQSIAIGDFDGDTIQDLATANFGSNDVSILLGNGDGTFGAATNFVSGGQSPQSIAIGDFDGDTIQDLTVANLSSHEVSILFGNGDGTFALPDVYGGIGFDDVRGVIVDHLGNIIVTGIAFSSAFPTTVGTYDDAYSGRGDGFISKLTNDLSATTLNNPPTSQNDEYLVTQDTQLILNSQSGVLSNDDDPDGDTLVASIETTTSNGILTLNPDGSFSYQPNSGFLGTDSFTYVADDGNGGTDIATVEFIVRSPTSVGTRIICDNNGPPDNDSDNICDGWESDGLKIDELDGSTLLIPFEFGPSFDITCVSNFGCLPDPGNKDIYVEVDWMSEQAPDQSAIQDVVDAFANKGIRLHVLLDEDIGVQIEQTSVDFTDTDFTDPTGFVALKQNYFGTAQERLDALDEPKILEAKRQIFHYALFIHEQKERPGTSGWGEIKGNDFAVSLGSFGGGTGTPSEQSGTFMHELGHNLGLHHGGPENAGAEDDNCKPNYLSVMSYSFQFPSYLSDRPLDYSRSVLAPLDETSLDEAAGIQASTPPNLKTIYGPPAYRESVTGVGIDWDESGGISGTANTNINNLGILGCQSDTWSVLTGHDDWNNLVFDFRVQTHFDSGLTFYRTADQEMTVQAVDQIQESVITHQIEFFDSISDSALTGDPVLTRQAFEDAISEIQLLVQSDDFDNAILKIDQLIALVPTMISDQNELDNILDSLHNWRGTLASSNEEPIQLVTKTSQEQTQTLIEELENPLVTPQSKQTSDDISKAIDDLTNSLDDKFWTDPNTLDSQLGHEAIHLQEKAVKSLMKITNNQESDSMMSYIQEIIDKTVSIDRKIAQSAIIVAQADAASGDKITSALDAMAQGDKAVSEGKYDDAIHHYEKAWKDVR